MTKAQIIEWLLLYGQAPTPPYKVDHFTNINERSEAIDEGHLKYGSPPLNSKVATYYVLTNFAISRLEKHDE
tara:strand:- start:3438 stop:3653 length:216 start_codon:yes stop_codon:yes gene_type:complete